MTDERDGTQDEPEVEEAFVRALGDAARKLWNAPPETPSEEMWDEIRAARTGSTESADSAPSRRRFPQPKPWWIGVAAALMIGVGLGRVMDSPIGPAAQNDQQVADAGSVIEPTAEPAPAGLSDAAMLPGLSLARTPMMRVPMPERISGCLIG